MVFGPDGPVTLNDGQTDVLAGTASVSDDSTGELLLYSDGSTVWNGRHEIVRNGTNLGGHSLSAQSALLVPNPANVRQYYLLTASGSYMPWVIYYELETRIRFSIVDLDADGGRGAVTVGPIVIDDSASDRLTAVPIEGACGYWIIGREACGDELIVWRLDGDGLHAPVRRRAGIDDCGATGWLKASPDGKWLALASMSDGRMVHWGLMQAFRFDPRTGEPGPAILLDTLATYGACFARDSRHLYYSTEGTGQMEHDTGGIVTSITGLLWQAEIIEESGVPVLLSKTRLGHLYLSWATRSVWHFGAVQAAPDGRVYVVRNDAEMRPLAAVMYPEITGLACELRDSVVDLSPGIVKYSLPNMIDGETWRPVRRCEGNDRSGVPVEITLSSDPVPAAGSVVVRSPRVSFVELGVVDLFGRAVGIAPAGPQQFYSGTTRIPLHADQVASGWYMLTAQVEGVTTSIPFRVVH